jgi:hypothetical protein
VGVRVPRQAPVCSRLVQWKGVRLMSVQSGFDSLAGYFGHHTCPPSKAEMWVQVPPDKSVMPRQGAPAEESLANPVADLTPNGGKRRGEREGARWCNGSTPPPFHGSLVQRKNGGSTHLRRGIDTLGSYSGEALKASPPSSSRRRIRHRPSEGWD